MRDRERGAELDRQRGVLRRQRRRGAARPARARGRAGRRRRRPAARGPRRARRSSASASWPRRASSTSRATRPRSPATRSASPRSTATASSARRRSTCSRTRRTSSRSRCSSAGVSRVARARVCRSQAAPEQVGVREQEAERDARQRRQAGHVPPVDADHRQRRGRPSCPTHVQNGRSSKRTLAARKTAKKSDVRAARARPTPPPGTTNDDRDAAEDLLVVLGDLVRRAAPDRVGVDQRDQQPPRARPTTAPRRAGGTGTRRARSAAELAEVRRDRAGRPARRRRASTSEADRPPAAATRHGCARERQREPDEQERRRHQHERDQQDARPERPLVHVRRELVPRDERGDERPARSVRRQRGPPGPDRLEGVPEARLRRLLVERRVDVGHDERLDRRREALQLALRLARARARAGTRARSRTRARRRPSRRRGAAARSAARGAARRGDVSMSAPANLTQFVPNTSLASTCSRSSERFSACPARP